MNDKKRYFICDKGHRTSKNSDCPVCPICESQRKPTDGFLMHLSAPARRALESKNINTLHDLAQYSMKDILALHGMGKSSIPILSKLLSEEGLTFNE